MEYSPLEDDGNDGNDDDDEMGAWTKTVYDELETAEMTERN